ncbi:hypothetical protein Tco_0531037 [Tanacetum coccineum]
MDDPNFTMEEYIRLEEEKARKRGKVFNWQTATYGKIRVDDNFYDLRSMEAEFPAIVVKMDEPNITMEEYIRLEEEKAHKRGKVYNCETATYGKIWDNEDVHDLRSVETEFPASL